MLSGIGPADHLAQFDIPVVADLPGVGQNLQDHNEVFLSLSTKGPFGYFGEDAGIKLIRNVNAPAAPASDPARATEINIRKSSQSISCCIFARHVAIFDNCVANIRS